MKKLLTLSCILFISCVSLFSKPTITRVEPLSWWTNMSEPLTLMFYGTDLSDAQVSVQQLAGHRIMRGQCLGLKPIQQHNAESPNYLFVDMAVSQPGTYRITLTKSGRKATYDYTIAERTVGSASRLSFTSADVVYLIMSDRFVDGDISNNSTEDTQEKADKSNVDGRFGGDIQGIINSLDHIVDLGATTIWPTPLLMDDESTWSYHGYACSDYYHIDPRYGTNELYRKMVTTAHSKGLKVLMDMVPNHCGASHWWMKDLPYNDWVNHTDSFVVTNNCFSANYDINASCYDRTLSNTGWFDRPMPDMNLNNPDLLHYFTQWAIWWIEYAGLDGLRVDTYPYLEPLPASKWLANIRREYPSINIVGECWTRPASAVAYWQSGTPNRDGFDSHLPSVMDFPVEEAIRQALENDGNYWGGGLMKVYDAVAMDYLYADVNKLLLFVGNHDMDRFADIVKDQDPRRVKLGLTLIATMRGIPQLFAGDEYALSSADRSRGHSTIRMPYPAESELTDTQRDMYDYLRHLLIFRKTEPIIHYGRTMHFMSRDNTYAYFRYTDDGAIFVYANASEDARTIPVDHYAEILSNYSPVGTNIITGETIDLRDKNISVSPISSIVVKLTK